jgi:hypothetical protein
MDRNDVTRISDLPDNNLTRDMGSRGGAVQNQYQPLNIHQNPYGIPEPTDTKLPTMNVGPHGGGSLNGGSLNGGSLAALGGSGGFNGEAMKAPPSMMNRGGYHDTESFQNDEHIVPNHIPSTKLTTDYLREYEEKMAKEHVDQVRTDLRVSVYDEIQTPILIGVLFFLFQVPFLNALMFKYLGFLKIYSDDGNLNLYGLLFKSMLFGAVYFGFVKMTTSL